MLSASGRGHSIAALCLVGAALLYAQDWQTAVTLPGIDLTGLAPARQAIVLKVLRAQGCPCGCGMKLAECRVKDPNCSYSRGLSAAAVEAAKQGKSEANVIAAVKDHPLAHPPEPKLLDDPVPIPTVGSPMQGPKEAPITLVEFSDFQCPYCAKAVAQLNAVLKAYPTQVKLIFKQYPLETHPQASISAAAALAAHQQGKFWPMHDAMFANRERLSRKTILDLAGGLRLDMKKFTADLDSAEIKKLVARDVEDGDKARVEATPTLFIDGQRYNGVLELEVLAPVFAAEMKRLASKK